MIRLILAVAFAILTAALGAFLALNPGRASFEFLGTQMEMPFVVAAGAIILFAFLMLVIWWAIYMMWSSPDKVRAFMVRRRREQGYDALERALIASAAGDGEAAVRQAARAETLLDRPALSQLLAARAAEAAGNLEAAKIHYEALLEDTRTRLVGHRGLAQIANEEGDVDGVAEHAGEAFKSAKQARWAFDASFDAQVRNGDWEAALATLAEAERRKLIDLEPTRRRRAVLLTASALELEGEDRERARDMADGACRSAPEYAPGALVASRLMNASRRYKRAADILETAWKAAPHPALARAFRDLRKSDSKAKRNERLRGLAGLVPTHRESRILLVEVALDEGHAIEADTLLKPLLEDGVPSARLCALAARLARLKDEDETARRWMTRASHAAGEADWSDLEPDGGAFVYETQDWQRMVYAFGDDGRLIHPRYERYERSIEAVPETALLAPPRRTGPASSGSHETSSPTSLARQPDDPGVGGDDEGAGRAA